MSALSHCRSEAHKSFHYLTEVMRKTIWGTYWSQLLSDLDQIRRRLAALNCNEPVVNYQEIYRQEYDLPNFIHDYFLCLSAR